MSYDTAVPLAAEINKVVIYICPTIGPSQHADGWNMHIVKEMKQVSMLIKDTMMHIHGTIQRNYFRTFSMDEGNG